MGVDWSSSIKFLLTKSLCKKFSFFTSLNGEIIDAARIKPIAAILKKNFLNIDDGHFFPHGGLPLFINRNEING